VALVALASRGFERVLPPTGHSSRECMLTTWLLLHYQSVECVPSLIISCKYICTGRQCTDHSRPQLHPFPVAGVLLGRLPARIQRQNKARVRRLHHHK